MRKIHQCASEQGQGASSLELGSHLQIKDRFDEAVKAYHKRVKTVTICLHIFFLMPLRQKKAVTTF